VPENSPAALIIRTETSSVKVAAPLEETIVTQSTSSVEEILFLVNAKLGRLTKSDLANAKHETSPKSGITRRKFLLGPFSSNFLGRSDSPVVSIDSCEARFGCTKCVDACPAPGALKIEKDVVTVSSEHCIRCGLCAGVCPVAAIQMPKFSEDAYRGLLTAIHASSAPTKSLVITCNERSLPPQAWMDVEEVPGISVVGIRQLAMAANTSLGALLVYCADGLCAGKENVRRATTLISSIVGEDGTVVAYLEGETGVERLVEIHKSTRTRDRLFDAIGNPWKDYVKSLRSISTAQQEATGLGLTSIEVADSCTLCNACVEACPHHVLAIQQDKLSFQPEECTGCGYCAQICPEHSIALSEMKGPMTMQTRTVYADEMIRCAKCGNPYASARMVKKVSTMLHDDETTKLCPSCRQREIHEKIFAAVTD